MIMAYIRDRKEELTCYQEAGPVTPWVDIGQDIAIVYGTDPGMPARVKGFKDRGYVVHLMTGIAWGNYMDFFNGEWDGTEHWDEIQLNRDGSITGESIHATGYICPTIPYLEYLTEKMKVAVDAGVEAIHVEEPEYLNASGYCEGIKREYEMYYHEPWVAPHVSVDAHYKIARLKAYLYRRAIERTSQSLCSYAKRKYGRTLRFYVPTHSLLNYSQWKVMSPEGTLTDVPTLDGYKAQIWMGTSREPNVYGGKYRERTFETAFLEYGVMQELVRGTERTMWFDNDPIEDNPKHDWNDYRKNYREVLMGSLLQPKINRFQLCPWPSRFLPDNCKYPWGQPDATPIPEDYRTELFNIFQMQGTFGTEDFEYENEMPDVGVFLSDTAMFQRNFSDDVMADKFNEKYEKIGNIEIVSAANYGSSIRQLKEGNRLDYYESGAFPLFYGLTLPLLKGGLPVRPVQLENITRYPTYLDNYKLLVLSYEFQKPLTADINTTLANYVADGGILVYVGDGIDPFHNIKSWWNTGKQNYKTALEHLMKAMAIPLNAEDGEYTYGDGKFVLIRKSPADFTYKVEDAKAYRELIGKLIGKELNKNYISLRRGEYYVTAVMDESDTDEPFVHEGLFADMFDINFKVITKKVIKPNEYAVLYDLTKIADKENEIIGTSIRINKFDVTDEGFTVEGTGAYCEAKMRLKLKKQPKEVMVTINTAVGNETLTEKAEIEWDELSSSVLISFHNTSGDTKLVGIF